MKSQSWYKKQYGLLWWMQYKLDSIAEGDRKSATKKAKENSSKIANRAKEQSKLDRKFGR